MFLRRLVLFLFLLVLLDLEILEPPPVRNFPEVNIGFILFWAGLRPLEVVGVEDGGDSFGFASITDIRDFLCVGKVWDLVSLSLFLGCMFIHIWNYLITLFLPLVLPVSSVQIG